MAPNYGPKITTDGLVLALDAANPKSYPGTGTTWYDISGNGNDGTLVNNVGYNIDNKGFFTFDGVDNYGYIEESSTIKPTEEITVCAFIYPNLSSYNNTRIIGDWHQSGAYDRWIFYANGNTIIWHLDLSSSSSGGPSWPIVPNSWVCYVGRYNGISRDIFINGVLYSGEAASGTMNGGDGNRPIRFGYQGPYSGTASAGNVFDGNISDIKLYNRAITDTEIKQNFEATRGRYGI